jgi:hypothetical protein
MGRNVAEQKPDKMLDDYLRGDAPLTRAYREIAREEPPARLDAAILAQAKAAVAPRRGGKPRWLMPLSLAATVALAVGVALFMAREGAGPLPPETVPAAKPDTSAAPAPKAPRFDARDVAVPQKLKTPEQWLADIEALRKLGLDADADAQLAEFRKHYPDYPIKR